jgi:hypothetical protein
MATLWTKIDFEGGDLSQFSSTSDTAANTSATASGTAAKNGSYGMLVTSNEASDVNTACYGQINFTSPASSIIRVQYWFRQDYDNDPGYNSTANAKAHFELGSTVYGRAAIAFINRANGDLNLGITNDSFARVNLATWSPTADTWYLLRLTFDWSGSSLAYKWEYSTDGTSFTSIVNSTTTSHRFDNDGSDYARFGHIHINQWEKSDFSEWFDDIEGFDSAAVTGYTLTAAQGSLTLSGQAATPKYGRLLTAAQGSYTLSGQAAGLLFGYRLTAAQGSYALTGQAAGLAYSGSTYTLVAAQGSLTLTGQAAGLLTARLLTAAQGSYALTGQAAGLLFGYRLTAAQGAHTLTGQAAGLLAARLLTAAQGSYTLSGQAVALLIARLIAAGQGGYTLTGRAVALTYSGDTFTTPANRIYIIEAEARTLTVAAEIRSHLVDGETRIYSVRGE